MTLWVKLVEAIFQRRGRARQEKLDTWLTGTMPERSWRDTYKEKVIKSSSNMGRDLRGSIQDPG